MPENKSLRQGEHFAYFKCRCGMSRSIGAPEVQETIRCLQCGVALIIKRNPDSTFKMMLEDPQNASAYGGLQPADRVRTYVVELQHPGPSCLRENREVHPYSAVDAITQAQHGTLRQWPSPQVIGVAPKE